MVVVVATARETSTATEIPSSSDGDEEKGGGDGDEEKGGGGGGGGGGDDDEKGGGESAVVRDAETPKNKRPRPTAPFGVTDGSSSDIGRGKKKRKSVRVPAAAASEAALREAAVSHAKVAKVVGGGVNGGVGQRSSRTGGQRANRPHGRSSPTGGGQRSSPTGGGGAVARVRVRALGRRWPAIADSA